MIEQHHEVDEELTFNRVVAVAKDYLALEKIFDELRFIYPQAECKIYLS
jgi:hypothetical protein